MGTSTIYQGPVKNNPLLPDDYLSGDSNVVGADNAQSVPEVEWKTVKTNLSKIINGTYGGSPRRNYEHVVGQYVKASGGSSRMVQAAHSGVRAGRALGGFFRNINNNGIEDSLRDIQVEFENKSANEVISLIVDALAPDAVTKEDIVARSAMMDAMSFVYDYIERNNMNMECLNIMPPELSMKSMRAYMQSYIWGLMQRDLQSRFEKYESDPKKAKSIRSDFKEIVQSTVDVEFGKIKGSTDFSSKQVIPEIMGKCFMALEGLD